MKALALTILLFVAQALLRPERTPGADRDLLRRHPAAWQLAVIGGFRPLLVRHLWMSFETAVHDGRVAEADRTLRLLVDLEPLNARAVLYLAHYLAHQASGWEVARTARLGRIVEAIEILTTAESRMPGDPHLPLERGRILSGPWRSDPVMHRAFVRNTGRTPTEAAVEAFDSAAALAPGSGRARILLTDALRMRGIELLLTEGPAPAHAPLARAAVEARRLAGTEAGPVGLLAASWADIAAGLAGDGPLKVADGLAAAARALRELPPPFEGMAEEDTLLASILKPALDFCVARASISPPADGLSATLALHSMRALLDERARAGGVEGVADPGFDAQLRVLVAVLLDRAPDLRDRVPQGLRPDQR